MTVPCTTHLFDTHPNGILSFSLPSLLLESQLLIVHLSLRVVTLLEREKVKLPLIGQCQLSQHALLVFVGTLYHFPHYCRYQELLEGLYPQQKHEGLSQRTSDIHEWDVLMRSVYRAVNKGNQQLKPLGLYMHSVRELGYQISRPC